MIFCYKLLECESNNFLVKTKSNAFLVKTDLEGGSKSSISEKWIDNKAIDFKNTKWLSKLYKTEYLFSNGLYTISKRKATVDDVLDPCSGARKAHPGEKKQVDVPCGGKAKLHCKGGCIR